MTVPIRQILEDPDRTRRRDRLADRLRALRRGECSIDDLDSDALFKAMAAETRREAFDGLMYNQLWLLIRYARPLEKLRKAAFNRLRMPDTTCRGDSLAYLMRAYPAERDALIEQYGADEDPYVQDAIAHAQAEDDPAAAVERWMRVLDMRGISHELAEATPQNIAYRLEPSELERTSEECMARDREQGGGTLWAITAGAIGARMDREQEEQA